MFSKDPTYPLFPIFAFLGFVLSLVPLPWHLQAWNSGTCAFMIWTAVACLVSFVNSLIWNNSLANVAPVWCDIATQLVLASGVGLPAATLCISRRLYKITSVQTVSITRDDKRRAIYVDLAIALGIPILVLLLHMIVQPHRFNIFEGVGCVPVTYNTLPAYFLFYMWPILLGLISLTYSSMTLRSFYMRRLQFNQLTRANSALNPSRYFRLMLLAIIDILCTIPLGVYTIYTSLHGLPLAPWISWDDTHFDFGRIVQYPTLIWRNTPGLSSAIEVNRWLPVACAFAFFIIFGFAEEARKSYRRAFLFVGKPFGYAPKKKLTIPP
ncbi:STE3-like pheromone receptor [Dendrothele bispora CBS 962.96]|uniref:STE3-like pheromone receptor n=1 Tax=Dendrothele bispora (strain CBS 962.96) TaxID=1314807 RepID=A0A4S8L5X3_DENBC|nr:STE3-like pheromone receptor [Dendrothele bispora CBS 962.96]